MGRKVKKFSDLYPAQSYKTSTKVRHFVRDGWKALESVAENDSELLFKAMFLHSDKARTLRKEQTQNEVNSSRSPQVKKLLKHFSKEINSIDLHSSPEDQRFKLKLVGMLADAFDFSYRNLNKQFGLSVQQNLVGNAKRKMSS